ncbi:MAG: DUF2334 domain-containing protein [Thermoleophilia bacterium]
MSELIVSIHDVAPSTLEQAREWRERVGEMTAAPVALLVVPCRGGREGWTAATAGWVRERAAEDDELVLHGWSHVRPDGSDGAELRGLSGPVIAARLGLGLDQLARAGMRAGGLIAPAYGHPAAVDAVCAGLGLRWWATRTRLRWSGGEARLPSLGVGASTRLKRALSPAAAHAGARALRRARAVRLDLHPADLRHPRLAAAGRDLLDLLLDQGRAPVTHAAYAAAASRAPRS